MFASVRKALAKRSTGQVTERNVHRERFRMTLSLLFIIVAAVLFVLAVVPKLQRPWMMGIGMALFAASFLPYFSMRIGN